MVNCMNVGKDAVLWGQSKPFKHIGISINIAAWNLRLELLDSRISYAETSFNSGFKSGNHRHRLVVLITLLEVILRWVLFPTFHIFS